VFGGRRTKEKSIRSGYLRYLFTGLLHAHSEADFLKLLPNRVKQTDIDAAAMKAVA
jgi:hypothetical protein